MRSLAVLAVLVAAAPLCAKEPGPLIIPNGEPVNCVIIRNIRSTNVVDDKTIDFVMNGRKTLRNTLPNRCPQLGLQGAFAYSTSNNQLCNVDIITVIVQGGGSARGASCGLGMFIPITTLPKK